ncbi:hypothetical protein D3C76_1813050 [compost metagenome]
MFIKKWVLTSATFQSLKIGFVPGGISQCDRDIAQPAQMSDAANSRSLRYLQKPGFAPGKQLDERWRVQGLTWAEVVLFR